MEAIIKPRVWSHRRRGERRDAEAGRQVRHGSGVREEVSAAAQVREQVIREKVVKLVADSAVAVAPEAEEKKEDKAEETAE